MKFMSPQEWFESTQKTWREMPPDLRLVVEISFGIAVALALLVICVAPADATTFFDPPTVTLTDGTTANASDVNTNFTDIIADGNAGRTTLLNSLTALGPIGLPSKGVIIVNDTVCPTGYTIANGANSSPDLRGVFVRGFGGTSGALGALQADQIQQHTHLDGAVDDISSSLGATAGNFNAGASPRVTAFTAAAAPSPTTTMTTGGSGEARPDAVVFMYCMKQ
jgi:hypothetical protein